MNRKILVVDDESDILKILTIRLSKAGYNLIMAHNGQEAIDLARKEAPDLILMDCQMPVLDGLEACKQIKADSRLHCIPLILMTATPGIFEEDAIKAKADAYIKKPFEDGELIAKVREFIDKKGS
jgi:CheY-like chemotaxis protein